jgi:hypothetical protein
MFIPNSVFWAPFEFCEGELISFAVSCLQSLAETCQECARRRAIHPLHPHRLLSAIRIRYFSTMRMFPRDETRGVVARNVIVTSSDNKTV